MLKILCSDFTVFRQLGVGNMFCTRFIRRSICSSSLFVNQNPLENARGDRLSHERCLKPSNHSSSRNYSIYEADGKTFGIVLNKKNASVFFVNQLGIEGFVLTNGLQLMGPTIVFPHAVLSWNIVCAKDVCEESLVLFKLLEPKIDILVFGYGNWKDYTPEVRETFTKSCKKLGIRYEALPTEHAVGTYNFLAEDRVLVAGAFIPPTHLDPLRFDRTASSIDYDALLESEEEEVPALPTQSPVRKLIK